MEKPFESSIKRIREEKGFSQTEFAEKVGIRHWHLCKVENGQSRPSVPLLEKIASELGVELKDIFL